MDTLKVALKFHSTIRIYYVGKEISLNFNKFTLPYELISEEGRFNISIQQPGGVEAAKFRPFTFAVLEKNPTATHPKTHAHVYIFILTVIYYFNVYQF
jgi:hypothetical protein